MLNLLFVSLLVAAADTGGAQANDVSPKCSAYEGRARQECLAKDTHPEENGPSTKGVKIDEAHRTAPENKADQGKNTRAPDDSSSAAGSSAASPAPENEPESGSDRTNDASQDSSTQGRAATPR